ncbi:MAG: dihydrofolate reductase [Chloracidobacterium sp.]|nr:dihydrofolate reductase [Chloracidobacterium sp.]
MITGIVAIAKNHAIGRDGKLPWHYSVDLKFFKETTVGNAVVMGANTWRSIGKPLPRRLNIVLTRSGNVDTPESVVKLNNKQAVIELAKHAKGDIFIIGGAQVYRDLADVIDKWIVTEIPITVADADTFMPQDFLDGFVLEQTIDLGDELVVKILHRK